MVASSSIGGAGKANSAFGSKLLSKNFAYQTASLCTPPERPKDYKPTQEDFDFKFEEGLEAGPTSDTRELMDHGTPNLNTAVSDFEIS